MAENLDSYAKAFAELENNEKDLGTWAKAFSETSSEDDAKKLYIKLRVEQLDASEPQARPEVSETPIYAARNHQYSARVARPSSCQYCWINTR